MTALAIMLALGSPELDVMGICTVSGNVPLNTGTHNAQGLLQLLGPPRNTVFAGANQPLKRDPVFATEVSGEAAWDKPDCQNPPRRCKRRRRRFPRTNPIRSTGRNHSNSRRTPDKSGTGRTTPARNTSKSQTGHCHGRSHCRNGQLNNP